ncbi:MAG: phospho-sugar mutase [Granulosicoccus sp.]|nr:phospho-sugar mutase [Granulosicoccus sp.]
MNVDALRNHASLWAARDPDPETSAFVQGCIESSDIETLQALFASRLDFGTAGMRGIRGPGPARMNRLLVRLTTRALGLTLLDRVTNAARRGVVVGFDARHLSQSMARDTCGVLIALGIRVHFIDYLAPTPLVPFAVLDTCAAAGIVLTASHNPPQYNGFKVYWDNGAPIVPPIDAAISSAIDAIDLHDELPCVALEDAIAADLLNMLGPELQEQYLDSILKPAKATTTTTTTEAEAEAEAEADADADKAGQVSAKVAGEAGKLGTEAPAELAIVYTPLHGVAGELCLRALAKKGFTNVSVVAEQIQPDGDFPTVDIPNPEDPGALQLALVQARRERAELVLANDPDGDRLAVIVRHADDYAILSGDQIGWLLADHILASHAAADALPPGAFVVSTLVSSVLIDAIAGYYGVCSERTLTGLKWVWHRALELEQAGGVFMFGYEESIGYSVSSAVRDKDGISAAVLFAELVRTCARQGQTVLDRLDQIYLRAGYSTVRTINIAFTHPEDCARVTQEIERIRANPPQKIGPCAIDALSDYLRGVRIETATAQRTTLEMPVSNLLQLELAGGSRISLRPSGTEPKFKVYIECHVPRKDIVSLEETRRAAAATIEQLEHAIRQLL